MKASKLKKLFDDLEYCTNCNPVLSGVHFGCDCGCGGDFYTSESWNEAIKDYEDAKQALIEVCADIGLEWDLYEDEE